MATSRHASPCIVTADRQVNTLQRIELGDSSDEAHWREEDLQRLVHDHPQLIPMDQIEPAFTPLVSICTELPTRTGRLDNLWMTPEGGVVIGECKRVRNNQARREVLVQALDYARELHAVDYEGLQGAVRLAKGDSTLSLWSLVSSASEEGECPDEPDFINAVERRLRTGRFVVLLILDGVQEALESLTNYLQLHAGLHASVAIVELSLWMHGRERIVVPRVPLRTVLVERGIVVVPEHSGVSIAAPPASVSARSTPRRFTVSEEEYLSQLESRLPGVRDPFMRLLRALEEVGITPEFGRSVVLRFMAGPNLPASAGYVDASGAVWVGDAVGSARKVGRPELGEAYLAQVASLMGGRVHRYENPGTAPQLKTAQGATVRLPDLLPHARAWGLAVGEFVQRVTAAVQQASD